MACFLAPAAVAVVTTVAQKVVQERERVAAGPEAQTGKTTGKWARRLCWLNTMLWGGVALLCLEHIWHGEIVPWPPFLTAMATPGEVGPMLHEILTYGGTMVVVILVAWGILVAIAEIAERRTKAVGLSEMKPTSHGRGA